MRQGAGAPQRGEPGALARPLDQLLPKRRHLARGHHAAMAYDAVPSFIGDLQSRQATAALALEFAILTAARSGEVLGARWDEFDLDRAVGTVTASRMKAGREHRVPLSPRALSIVNTLHAMRTNDFVFAGEKPGKPLSGMAMEMVLRRMKIENATVHGFRSSFRDWAAECTNFPNEVCEAALAHVIENKAEAAYRRGDLFEKRQQVDEHLGRVLRHADREDNYSIWTLVTVIVARIPSREQSMAKTIDQKPVHEHRNATDVREKAQNEYRDRMQRSSEREGRRAKATQLAAALWKRLVHAVGEGEARGSMRLVMGSGKAGPRPTDDANALKRHIYMHIRTSPPGQSDDVIANRILGRNPSYVQCQSGDVIIVDNVIGEPDLGTRTIRSLRSVR